MLNGILGITMRFLFDAFSQIAGENWSRYFWIEFDKHFLIVILYSGSDIYACDVNHGHRQELSRVESA